MNKRGFTTIELLIVVAIIALVGTMAAVAVNSARSKQRDATRLANVRQMQNALENYFNERNGYPPGENLPLGDGRLSACLGSDGFAPDCSGADMLFMRIVTGTYGAGLAGDVVCGEPAYKAFCYSQEAEGRGYAIEFELENKLSSVGLIEGPNCATEEGIRGGRCE